MTRRAAMTRRRRPTASRRQLEVTFSPCAQRASMATAEPRLLASATTRSGSSMMKRIVLQIGRRIDAEADRIQRGDRKGDGSNPAPRCVERSPMGIPDRNAAAEVTAR